MDRMRFDRRYYERFYGDAKTRVTSQSDTARLARFVTGYLDYLGIEVKTVLDVGCGLGYWKKPLKRAYPKVQYTGLEYSPHLAKEHGWVEGSIKTYAGPRADLVVCQGVLQYLTDRELPPAIENLARLTKGALYLEALSREDWDENADRSVTDGAVHLRAASRYRRLLGQAGMRACGGGVYLAPHSTVVLYELERGLDVITPPTKSAADKPRS